MAQTVKNSPAIKETWVWSLGGGQGNPLQYSCLENPHGQRSLAGYSPWSRKGSHMTDQLSTRSTALFRLGSGVLGQTQLILTGAGWSRWLICEGSPLLHVFSHAPTEVAQKWSNGGGGVNSQKNKQKQAKPLEAVAHPHRVSFQPSFQVWNKSQVQSRFKWWGK